MQSMAHRRLRDDVMKFWLPMDGQQAILYRYSKAQWKNKLRYGHGQMYVRLDV